MDVPTSDIRCCILIRGTRSSTTKEIIDNYCEKYGRINYSRYVFRPDSVIRGYNVVFKAAQSVNRFMDDRPHRIDGQKVKVKRCTSPNEEWKLTPVILLTTSDDSADKQIFQEQTLRDYFSKYGLIHACHIDMYHNHPCAYLTFTDYDRVDQLINDKPHVINKVTMNIRKHVMTDNQTAKTSGKRWLKPSTELEPSRIKQQRSSSIIDVQQKENETIDQKYSSDSLIHELQLSISTPGRSMEKTKSNNEIFRLQNEYERCNTQIRKLRHGSNNQSNEILNKLEIDVEALLEQIKSIQATKKTFLDQLFDKYTVEYILSLNEHDINQRIEQLERENQLLLLIKQNMPTGNLL